MINHQLLGENIVTPALLRVQMAGVFSYRPTDTGVEVRGSLSLLRAQKLKSSRESQQTKSTYTQIAALEL